MNDDDNKERDDAEAETIPEAEASEAAGDAEAASPPVRPDTVTITSRGWFNRRPPKRRN